jgi:uncharacterized protein YbbC (DUF1343 family)
MALFYFSKNMISYQSIVFRLKTLLAAALLLYAPLHGRAQASHIVRGDERLDQLLPLLKNKRVALLVNQTAVIHNTHLVDTLLALHVNIRKIFAPEHGFRGDADAGEHLTDSMDAKTGIHVVSLYGKKTKPSREDLTGIDVVVYDVQDVGARFYTFISTLHYLMEACGEYGKPLIVLDRPNPNGAYVDGPVLKKEFRSFVGVDPIPVLHGLTAGEYAQMVNGEKWLPKNIYCKVRVITCLHYTHSMAYQLPVKPSPNLPGAQAVALYPSLCFFEGTNISVGRGTDFPFQVIGAPETVFDGAFTFTPVSKPGAKNPPQQDKKCFGYDLRKVKAGGLTFKYLIDMYKLWPVKSSFFLPSGFFDKLCGTDQVRKLIEAGGTEADIKASYKNELEAYKLVRNKYLLYKD